jgi:hypothetical protein
MYNDLFQTEPKPSAADIKARDLAAKYHYECETFDRTVCTGPVVRGSIMPANARELAAIGRHSKNVMHRIMREAEFHGIDRAYMRKVITSTEY